MDVVLDYRRLVIPVFGVIPSLTFAIQPCNASKSRLVLSCVGAELVGGGFFLGGGGAVLTLCAICG